MLIIRQHRYEVLYDWAAVSYFFHTHTQYRMYGTLEYQEVWRIPGMFIVELLQ